MSIHLDFAYIDYERKKCVRRWKNMLEDIMSYIPEYMKKGINSTEFEKNNVRLQQQKQVPGMAYVPEQKWQDIYSPDVAIKRGTLFPDLDKPFIGEGAVMNG